MTANRKQISSKVTCSYDRQNDWQRCCANVMGFEWVEHVDGAPEGTPSSSSPVQQIINLVEEDDAPGHQKAADPIHPWTENALRIQADMLRMAHWIQSKKHQYVGLDMPDDEASLVQSTVTSFAATTAAELETLRKIIPTSGGNVASHRNGVVQILLTQLQEQITQPFGRLQKQRSRASVQLWQNPWQCRLYQRKANKPKTASSQFFEEEEDLDTDQRFMPRGPVMPMDTRFFDNYDTNMQQEETFPPPQFLDSISSAHTEAEVSAFDTSDITPKVNPNPTPILQGSRPQIVEYPEEAVQQQFEQDLQQEAVLMQQSVTQNDLDSAQKMEQRMVEITTLIGQFSNLVSEQQEEVWDIAKSAEQTKENIDKGQDSLVDATERSKRSKHYMAWTIFGLSLALLFFNSIWN
eukprot:Nitzschia sp. Nitz4//scaffold2_size372955//36421//37644//NITZ4_000363-RA/size372955-processed-gene-0.470-mRNA-1//-1//CDS//3329546596//8405//frame0